MPNQKKSIKEEIEKEFEKCITYSQVEALAENLTYKLIPEAKRSNWRARYTSLTRKDVEELGYNVFEIRIEEDKEKLVKKIKSEGFLYVYDIYFNPKTKEVWSIRNDYMGLYVSIDENTPLHTKENLEKFISLNEYKNLLVKKILERLTEWQSFKDFINSLIVKEKKFYEQQLEEEKKEEIIIKALEEARRRGIIK